MTVPCGGLKPAPQGTAGSHSAKHNRFLWLVKSGLLREREREKERDHNVFSLRELRALAHSRARA